MRISVFLRASVAQEETSASPAHRKFIPNRILNASKDGIRNVRLRFGIKCGRDTPFENIEPARPYGKY